MPFYDPGIGQHVVIDGQIVERDALYIVEKLQEINPNLVVLCLDPAVASDITEAPFIVCELVGDQVYKIFDCWQLDDTVVERVRMSDTHKIDVLEALAQKELAKKREAEYEASQQREANKELVTAIIDSRKSSFSFEKEDGTKVTLYDDRPAKVE